MSLTQQTSTSGLAPEQQSTLQGLVGSWLGPSLLHLKPAVLHGVFQEPRYWKSSKTCVTRALPAVKYQNLELELTWSSQRLQTCCCGARSLESRTCQPQYQHSSSTQSNAQRGPKRLSWSHYCQSFQILRANAGSPGFLGVLVSQAAQAQKYAKYAFFGVTFKNVTHVFEYIVTLLYSLCIWTI